MANGAVQEVNRVQEVKELVPKVKFLLGTSESKTSNAQEYYFEPMEAFVKFGKLNATDAETEAIVGKLFQNPALQLEVTGPRGRGLKASLKLPSGVVRFFGFISAGEYQVTLDESDIEPALEAGRTQVRRMVGLDDLWYMADEAHPGWTK